MAKKFGFLEAPASFRPGLLPTLAMMVAVVVCVRLGLWQQHKAEAKRSLQAQLDLRSMEPLTAMPSVGIADAGSWRYRRVSARGEYDPRFQILLDNQVQQEVPGYHVITPLRLENGMHVLVDRGWVVAPPDHQVLPQVMTPAGMQQITGALWLPPEKYFSLAKTPRQTTWPPVWQTLDMKDVAATVPFPIQPLVIRLDAASAGGGFVRDWPKPAERVEMHESYAYQWYGFAAAFALIYLVVNFRKSHG